MDGLFEPYIYIRSKLDGSIAGSVAVEEFDERTIRRRMREALEQMDTETQYLDDRGVRAAQEKEARHEPETVR
jgi:hypothetical protein